MQVWCRAIFVENIPSFYLKEKVNRLCQCDRKNSQVQFSSIKKRAFTRGYCYWVFRKLFGKPNSCCVRVGVFFLKSSVRWSVSAKSAIFRGEHVSSVLQHKSAAGFLRPVAPAAPRMTTTVSGRRSTLPFSGVFCHSCLTFHLNLTPTSFPRRCSRECRFV